MFSSLREFLIFVFSLNQNSGTGRFVLNKPLFVMCSASTLYSHVASVRLKTIFCTFYVPTHPAQQRVISKSNKY